ncbi:MAG: Tol-Pal system beta propeller repeat protein TolB [Deltaproteobacteria bacterium]|nr:Tol-Pal system beta propeller repeat protein TolB [Deltaproteobacteria bacterium]
MKHKRYNYNKLPYCFIAIFLIILFPFQGYAKVYIDINAPAGKRLPIAIPDIKIAGILSAEPEVMSRLRDALVRDLEFSGLFSIIDKKAYVEDPNKKPDDIDFNDWRIIGADVLIKSVSALEKDDLTVELKLYDTVQAKMLIGRRYIGKTTTVRTIAHKFADEVMEALAGEKGIFDTKLLFTSGISGGKEIFLADYDGYNLRQITKNRSINLSPQWSPDGKKILYTSYKEGRPCLYMLELATGREIRLAGYPGINISARWSPMGKEIAMTLSKDGNPELYILELDGMKLRRLTNNWAIDVSPSWSPDGKRLAFVSDIGGNPHIYVINSDGTGLTRLTYDGKYNAAPAWSPKGDKIAFARLNGGHFDILVMNSDGTGQVQLTENSGDNEDPSWSPDGRYIAFSSTRDGGVSRIYIMQADGSNQQQIIMENAERGSPAASPAWSPFLIQ